MPILLEAPIAEGEARGLTLGAGANSFEIVLIRKDGQLLAYENRCPHQGTPLETFPGKFLNEDGTLFICSTHGARFRISDGVCIRGPCLGRGLRRLTILNEEGLRIALTD